MGKIKYYNQKEYTYYSPRYNKNLTIPFNMPSDGATGPLVRDLVQEAWEVHDRACEHGKWDDGTKISRWQASCIYADILKENERWEWFPRKYATFLLGAKKLDWF